MLKKRVVLWWMLFIGIVVHMFQKTNINIAIVSMIRYKTENEAISTDGICGESNNAIISFFDRNTSNTTYYEVDEDESSQRKHSQDEGLPWDEHWQNLILGGFFWLAWPAQFCGGILAHRFGSKVTFGLSNFLACALSAAIPWLAPVNATVVLVLRVVQGFIASLGIPAGLVGIIGQWSPPDERGKFMSVFLGVAFGVAVGYPIFGTIGEYFGWQSVFYASTFMGTVWYGVWLAVVFDSPDKHPSISDDEKKYINERIGSNISKGKLPIPWRSILTSVPFLANVCSQFGTQWCIHTLNIYIPSYFRFVHGLDMKTGGYIAGGAFLLKSLVSICVASGTDLLIRKEYVGAQRVRKVSVFVSAIVGGIFMLAVPYADCDIKMVVACLLTAIALHGFFITGATVAILDMSPNFSSVLQGIAGTVAVSAGFLSPSLIDLLPYTNNMMDKWRWLFYIAAGFSVGSGAIFLLFSDSNLQSWNTPGTAAKPTKDSMEMGNGESETS